MTESLYPKHGNSGPAPIASDRFALELAYAQLAREEWLTARRVAEVRDMQAENRRAAIRLGFLVLAQLATMALVWWWPR